MRFKTFKANMNLSIIVFPGEYSPEGHFCLRENVYIR